MNQTYINIRPTTDSLPFSQPPPRAELIKVVQIGKLKGPFRGFRTRPTRFTFTNGVSWIQNESKYLYFFARNPRARVVYEAGLYRLEIDGTDETVQVIREIKPPEH